jgi:cytochrome b561
MQSLYRNLILIHALAFVMLLVTWLAGEAIKTQTGSPMAALYYVLHIFPGSVIFLLILFEWLVRNQGKLIQTPDMPWHLRLNRQMHRAYYLILLALPPTGVVIFFETMVSRPVYRLHSALFDLLLLLVGVNLASMVIGQLRPR